MRAACVACIVVLSARSPGADADPRGASRRLEAVQLGWVHSLVDEKDGNAATLSIEAGRLFAPGVGVTGLLRSGIYHRLRSESRYESVEEKRTDILVGPRIYVEAVPDRLLVALGAGVLISFGEDVDKSPQGQPFVEAYAGVLVLRSEHNELEVGVLGGLALDEELGWLGLAVGVRRREW